MEETKRPSKWARAANILVPLLLTLAGSILALEWGLRHSYQLIPLQVCASDPILANYYCQPYFEYDKPIRIAYRYEPGLKIKGYWDPADPYLSDVGPETRPSDRSDAFWFTLETDEMGFPNAETEWQDAYDIIVTGDSFTIRTAPRTWIELLAEQMGRSVLTLGAPSWTTLNEVEAVKQYGLDKQPDWVVVMYFEGNDLINAQQYLEKQASGLDWREYDMQDVAWYRRSVVYHMLRYWLRGLMGTAVSATVSEPHYRYPVTASTEAGAIPTVLKDVHLLPLSADYDTIARSDEFAAIQAALLEIQTLAEAQGARLLVVYVPSKEHVYWSRIWDPIDVNNILERTVTVSLSEGNHGHLVWQPPYLSYAEFNAHHGDQQRVLEDFARAHDIELLNLTPILWAQTIAQGELYHYADPHWNQAGNQLVADIIQDYIEAAEQGAAE